MAISDKLNYLIETKSQLKDMINYGLPTENQITNETTFRNYVKGIFEAFIESLRDSTTLYTNLPKISGNGTQITLNDTANAPMRITLKASELTQDGTPTPDTPQDIHTISGNNSVVVEGKNLFDKSNPYVNGWYNDSGVAQTSTTTGHFQNNIQVIPDTKYTISGYLVIPGENYANFQRIYFYDENGNWISRGANITTQNSYTFTTPNNCKYINFQLPNNSNLYPNAIYSKSLDTFQLELGNQATTYEPYVSQTAPINLPVENLFDENKISSVSNGTNNNGIITSTENTTSGTKNINVYYQNSTISVKSGQTLYFSADIKLDNNSTGNFSNINDGTNATTTKIVQPTISHEYQRYQTSFTYNADTTLNKILLQVTSLVGTFTAKNIQISLDKSVACTPYGTTPIEYCKIGNYEDEFIRNSGKNYVNLISDNLNASWDNGNSNKITIINNSTISTTADFSSWRGKAINIPNIKPSTTYTLSCKVISSTGTNSKTNISIRSYNGSTASTLNGNYGATVNNGQYTYTFTTPSDLINLGLSVSCATSGTSIISEIMINEGTTALPYEPYGTNQWYLKKNIGKVVLDGSWNWYVQSTNHYQVSMLPSSGAYKIYLARTGVGLSNYFAVKTSGTDVYLYPILEAGGTDYIRISNAVNQWSTLADFKTWLSNNNVEFYYPLSTPTYTQITGTLETQLNNIYEKLLSYKGTTNISQVNNDLPFVLGVSAIQDLE